MVIALVVSVTLASFQMGTVYADEVTAPAAEIVSEAETDATADQNTSSETVSESESEIKSEAATEPASEAKSETATETESEAKTEAEAESEAKSEAATEAESEAKSEAATEAESEAKSEAATEAESEAKSEMATEAESEAKSEAATEAESEAKPEAATEDVESAFLNKNGEEVIPSSLVGVDYNTVAESYDGEVNVLKQYVVSEETTADTIMESYIDEDGNLVMVISKGAEQEEVAATEEAGLLQTVFGLTAESSDSESAPTVDGSVGDNGSFSGWDDVPVSYEYNWNKTDAWVDGVHYTDTNSTDVRHGMQMFTDGENVYLNITFSREYGAFGTYANGNDYQFYVDGQMAAYQVEFADGSQLAQSKVAPGVYEVDVRHRASSISYTLVDGATAYYNVTPDNINNQLQIKLPLSELQKQNGSINLDNFSMIQFYTPNLMSDRISAAGSPTGSVPFAAAVFLLVPASYVWLKKRNEEELSFA